ncbi:MAG: sigma-70 family RNA polymerase sigma factor [Phycisphaerae bacterium]|nr:sigma-70 family RNA polymerase sigma factor [Phycisphaerae bacterium]
MNGRDVRLARSKLRAGRFRAPPTELWVVLDVRQGGYTESMYSQSATHVTLLKRLNDQQDSNAWRDFHERYGELIQGFARRRGLQAADCDDVLQEVLLSLSQAMPNFEYDPSKGKFRSYLKTVTLRAIFKRGQKKNKRGEIDLEYIEQATRAATNDHATEEAWEAEWRQYHLRQAMLMIDAEFNDADRKAFQRYAVQGMDARETAEALGLSIDQVYQAKSRITKRLSELIEGQVREEG